MPQTSVQHVNSLRIGSCKVEVGQDLASLINIGATRGNTTFEETWEEIVRMSANAGELSRGIKENSHKVSVSGEWLEIYLSNLNLLRGDIDVYATQTATQQTVTDEQVTLTGTKLKRLQNKQASGAECGAIVVTGLGGTPTYVRNTDFVVVVDSDGYTCIARTSASTIADGATVLVDYTYTPAANVTLKSGGKFTINPRVVRLTNTNEAGKIFRITVFKAYNAQGIKLDFLEDSNCDYTGLPFRLEGVRDTARAAGEQLFEIYDEQGVL